MNRPLMPQVFAGLGHVYSHMFEPLFFVVALTLPTVFDLSYAAVLTLILPGKILFGVAAPVVGVLGDRWRRTGMMSLFFFGVGGGALLAGLAHSPAQMMAGLTLIGLFGSIYHPVGIAWLVGVVTEQRGRVLGLNGLFGTWGPVIGGLAGGALTVAFGWRMAFLVPGAVVLLTGMVFLGLLGRGLIPEPPHTAEPPPPGKGRDRVRLYAVLAFALVAGGIIYQATQAGLPRLIADHLVQGDLARTLGQWGSHLSGPASVGAVGGAVALVYLVAGFFQVWAGRLADRHAFRAVYLWVFLLQAPALAVVALFSGVPLLVMAVVMVSLNVAAQPLENALVAQYTPPQYRGLAYGLKFILTFGVSAVGVVLVSVIYDTLGRALPLYLGLAALALVTTAIIATLPRQKGIH